MLSRQTLPGRGQPARLAWARPLGMAALSIAAWLPAHGQQTSINPSVPQTSPPSTATSVMRSNQGNSDPNADRAQQTGPIRLDSSAYPNPMGPNNGAANPATLPPMAPPPYIPGEFELYVQSLNGLLPIRRLGADLVFTKVEAQDAAPLVPSDYQLVPGDELLLSAWGSLDADLRLTLDRSGRISIPRVGPVMLAGVRYSDVADVITKRVGRQFKSFEVSVSLGQLRGVRVYVTGFAAQPGAYSMTSLSTLSAALVKAGGPTAAGSFRDIQLRRQGRVVSTFDFYDLLISGNRNGDAVLRPDDVIHVGPVGPQVAVLGSVNQPAVVELKDGDTVDNVLKMVGGFSAVADTSRLSVERLGDRLGTRVNQLSLPVDYTAPEQG